LPNDVDTNCSQITLYLLSETLNHCMITHFMNTGIPNSLMGTRCCHK